ncbi:MAG: cobyric acid synthase [Mariprofundaceae bacterium]|nr:cobyric acid synthase [Mariprofundaceae bacterium]
MNSLMIQGTASGVGKSVLVAGLCRLLARKGVKVAPFKPQNMSNNAAVTVDGGEIGRAQALQALACGIEPTVDMNPVLIKPEADHQAQLIVRGKAVGRLQAKRFRQDRIVLLDTVLASFESLKKTYDVVIVEGAGSPAEPNLREGDIANMGFAEVADVPVWLVGDINCGGVFASLKGSLDILSKSERNRVQALLINGFRGSRSLLDDALIWLKKETGKPLAGVIPRLNLDLPEEDAPFRHLAPSSDTSHDNLFQISVIAYPRMSNHDDIDPFTSEKDIHVRFVRSADELQGSDWVILPGSKHVASDLQWLKAQGFVEALQKHLRYGGKVLGMCGGMQMLGQWIEDDGVEGESIQGLALLPLSTVMQPEKILKKIDCMAPYPQATRVTGYEIHHGISDANEHLFPFTACSQDEQVWGTYVHGLFEQGEFRKHWLQVMGYANSDGLNQHERTLASLDLLADALEEHIQPELLEKLWKKGG